MWLLLAFLLVSCTPVQAQMVSPLLGQAPANVKDIPDAIYVSVYLDRLLSVSSVSYTHEVSAAG